MRILFVLLLLVISGCIINLAPPEKPARAPIDAPAPPNPADANRATLSEVMETCSLIQEEPSLPLACMFWYSDDGTPMMQVGVSARAAQQMGQLDKAEEIGDLVGNLGAAFCMATNQGGAFGVNKLDEKSMRVYSCRSREWGDWFSYDKDTPT